MTAEGKTARVAGVDAYWREAGAGRPLLLVHGLGASSYTWRELLPRLASKRRVIAPDLPGFGRSRAPSGFDFSLKGHSSWLVSFLDHLGLDNVDMAGNSLGGIVALMTAQDAPRRVGKLALIGTPVYLGDGPRFIWPLRWPLVGRVFEAALGPGLVRMIGRTAYCDPALMTEEVVAEYALPLKTAEGRRAAAETVRRVVPPDAELRTSRYPSLAHDVLMLRGVHDTVAGAASARKFCASAPKARLLELPDCNHVPQEERPDVVAAALEEFLDGR